MFSLCKLNKNYLLALLIFCAIFLRLYKIDQRFFFSSESDDKVWPIIKVVVEERPILVGVEAVSYLHHLFYPPFAIYIFAPILALSNLNPLSIEVVLGLLSGLTTYLLYKLGKELFGERTGLLAAFFYTFSFSIQRMDRYVWVVGPLIFFSTVIIFFLNKILIDRKNLKLALFLGCFLGLAFNFHYQTGIIFLSLLSLFLLYREKFINLKSFLIIIASVFFFFSPLLVFDLRHNFFNLEGVKILLTSKEPSLPLKEKLAASLLSLSQNFLSIFTQNFYFKMGEAGVPFWLQLSVAVFLLPFPIFSFLRSKKNSHKVSFLFFFFLIFFGLLGTTLIVNKFYRVNFYLFYLQPVFILFVALIFSFTLRKKILKVTTFALLFFFLVINLKDSLAFKREVNFKNQIKAVNFILDSSGEKIEVYFPKFPEDRYRFLFYYLGRKKGMDYQKMVFYQPWQPVNRARFVLYHQNQEPLPKAYRKFGGIIVEERSFDGD